jgi:ribosome-dependent ATPase
LPLGLRQRLSLAVAVLHRPEVLILDEPTSGVDPAARDDFWRLLIELSREQGVTIFLSTHFMNEAQRCDRISLMHAGKVLACDTPARCNASSRRNAGSRVRHLPGTGPGRSRTSAPAQMAPRHTATPCRAAVSASAPAGGGQPRRQGTAARQGAHGLRPAGAMFMMVIFGYGISLDVENLAFAVYDQDQTRKAAPIWRRFAARATSPNKPRSTTPELHRRLQRSEIKLALEIPPGFGRDLYAGRQPAVAAWLAACRFAPKPAATMWKPCTRPT